MHNKVLDFWFHEIDQAMWWKKDEKFDNEIRNRFLSLHNQAQQGELYLWRSSSRGALAEIIILDQFSRNMFRETPKAFESDMLALALSQSAIDKGFHEQLIKTERNFLFLPFMHSESKYIHEVALKLYTELDEPLILDFELKHKSIIDRFGRYPDRNKILGRQSTAQEIEFLKQPDSSF